MMNKTVLLIGAFVVLAILSGEGLIMDNRGKLSILQLYNLAKNAGFTGTDLIIAVAVALAESGGDPLAYGDIDIPVQGSASYGLWQINSHFHPEFGPDFEKLFDPVTNAYAAYVVYKQASNSFHPWSTFKNNAYAAFVDKINTVLDA